MAQMTRETAQAGEALLWQLYDQITAQVLLIRGAESDLLSGRTAQAMSERGPRAHCTELEGVGHAPTLIVPGQVALIQKFYKGIRVCLRASVLRSRPKRKLHEDQRYRNHRL